MPLASADFSAIWLTLKLESLTTLILLVIGTPIALWLARIEAWPGFVPMPRTVAGLYTA